MKELSSECKWVYVAYTFEKDASQVQEKKTGRLDIHINVGIELMQMLTVSRETMGPNDFPL